MFLLVIILSTLIIINDAAIIPSNDVRIVGGEEVDITKVPYQVALLRNGDFACGGSIIATNLILTAAHCVIRHPNAQYEIRAGSTNRTDGGQVVSVKKVYFNDKFNFTISYGDVAVLHLEKPLKLSETVQIVKMAPANAKLTEGDICRVAGWGEIDPRPIPELVENNILLRSYNKKNLETENNERMQQLFSVDIPYVEFERCKELYGIVPPYTPHPPILDDMICFGLNTGGKSPCFGDSGGAIVCNGTQYGIVSWGLGCAQPLLPSVFTSVPAQRKWIDEHSKLS